MPDFKFKLLSGEGHFLIYLPNCNFTMISIHWKVHHMACLIHTLSFIMINLYIEHFYLQLK